MKISQDLKSILRVGELMLRSRGVQREPYHTFGYLLAMRLFAKRWLRLAYLLLRLIPRRSPSFTLAQGYAAQILNIRQRFAKAEAQGRRALRAIQAHGCPHPPSHIQFVRDLAAAVRDQGRRVESLKIFEHAVELADALVAQHPDQARPLAWEKAHTLQALASTYALLGNYTAAIKQFREVQATYRREPDPEEVGHAEVLTNMAQAFASSGDLTSAEYSLLEAVDIAQRTGNRHQLEKITAVAAHWGVQAAVEATGGTIAAAAAQAAADGQYTTAYIRHCIAIKIALESGNVSLAAEQAGAARLLESHLEPHDINPPRLRAMEATILEQQGASGNAICGSLIGGANEWLNRLKAVGPDHEDFRAIADDLHDHFRRLAGRALRLERRAEALAAFEFGRALAWAADASPHTLAGMLHVNPFAPDGSGIDTASIVQLQQRIPADAVAISLAALPPNLVAFVVNPNGIEIATTAVGRTPDEAKELATAVRMLPKFLKDGAGVSAVPAAILHLGDSLRAIIGDRKIAWFAPNSFFHMVPWRTVLRHVGFAWEQLAFSVQFGLLHITNPLPTVDLRQKGCLALGHGSVDTWDFRKEAEHFIARWGEGAKLVPTCKPQDVQAALAQEGTAMISCHGEASATLRLLLTLEGGKTAADELLPAKANMWLLILSACESGVYDVAWGDDPVGFVPLALRRGVRRCVCTRWPIDAGFAATFFPLLAEELQHAATLEVALVNALAKTENDFRMWRDLSCVELLGA